MRFMTLIKMDESMPFGPPPPELFEAIEQLGKEAAADGSLLDQGGLMPSFAGTLMRVDDGKITVVDGPFTEAKEVIGGYAVHEVRTKEEALERARRFMQLHVDLWPGFEGTCEIRQLMDADFDPSTLGM